MVRPRWGLVALCAVPAPAAADTLRDLIAAAARADLRHERAQRDAAPDDDENICPAIPTDRTFEEALGAIVEVVDSGRPIFAQRDGKVVLRWRRDHLGLLDLEPRLDPAHSSTTLDHALRLPGAPPIALELVGDGTYYTGQAPIDVPGATAGVSTLTAIHGANAGAADARLALGRTSRLAATAADAIVDHAWWAAGVVLEQTAAGLAAQALGSIEIGAERQLSTSALISRLPDGGGDTWAQAHTVLGSGEQTTEVGLVGERLDRGGIAVDRLGGRLVIRRHRSWHGDHGLLVGGEVGGGRADRAAHTDVRAYAGDRWDLTSDVTIDAGVRWDRRALGGAAVELWSPRVELMIDPRGDRDAQIFAVVERDVALDEVSFGAWRTGPTYRDLAVAGYADAWGPMHWNAALRVRRAPGGVAERGLEATARWLVPQRHLDAQVEISQLERAATVTASWSHDRDRDALQLTAIARATPDDVAWGALAAVAHTPPGEHTGPTTSIGVELLDLDDAARRSAHLVLEASW